MSTTEDRARAAMRAIAATVRDAPPLELRPAQGLDLVPDEARSGRSRPGGTASPSRRWRSWLVPVTAAAVVVALAIALVLVKDIPNGSAVPGNTTPLTGPGGPLTGPGGAPRYYVALKFIAGKPPTPAQPGGGRYGLMVGDSLTGKTLATFTPPARTSFASVTAAADDLTFVILAVTSSNGSFLPLKGVTMTASWYKVQLSPGAARPARLSRLPVKPWSWAAADYANPSPGQIFATALSGSGQELAVADIPDVPAAKKQPSNWQEVKVFSVATGRLVHDWTENDPKTRLETVVAGTFAGVPTGTSALTWIDGDRALAFATSYDKSGTVTGTVRRLNVAGPASGSLMTDSTVIWSGTLPWNQSKGCFQVDDWPPLVSADGNTISCMTWVMTNASPGHVDFDTYPLAAGRQPVLDYRGTILPEKQTHGLAAGVLWVSPSADTLIVAWGGPGFTPSTGSHFGVISHGKFTPLPLQANRAALTAAGIAF